MAEGDRVLAEGRGSREAPDALVAIGKPERHIIRKVMLGVVVILFLMRLGIERRPDAPALAADCQKAAFRLSTQRVGMGGPVTVTMVGPAGRHYVIGVDTETFRQRAGRWEPVPRAGAQPVHTLDEVMPAGCLRNDYFAIPGPVGKHTVTMYELTERGAVFVSQQEIEVLDRQP